jgi:hypothetical protein
MSTQIFKSAIPNEIVFSLLNEICIKTEKCYILNIDSFKKGLFKDIFPKFIEDCKLFYHVSKRTYLEKNITYKSIITILRQICKFNNIVYTSQIKYDKSTYSIVYYIYKPIINIKA